MEDLVTVQVLEDREILRKMSFPAAGEIIVGRKGDCQVVLEGREVSRTHAILRVGGDSVRVECLSPNGCTLKGAQVDGEFPLAFGEELGVGPYNIIVLRSRVQKERDNPQLLRSRVLEALIGRVDLDSVRQADSSLRPRVEAALERLLHEHGVERGHGREELVSQLADEALGLGPLERLLEDEDISEIMVVDPGAVFVERRGKLEHTDLRFSSADSVRTILERIVTPLGRRIDESSPMVDARLTDGSRVNAIIPPLAIRGPSITIRKFTKTPLTMEDLIRFGTLDEEAATFLEAAVRTRRNTVISGGTGSGKTTLLNILAAAIPPGERIITVEDAAELRLGQPHVVTLETRPPNTEGRGEVTIRDLVRNALRMRPDRIVVGECRGGEALDMLQAMNTGHDGSLTTTHANSPREAISRLETLCLMAGIDLPSRAIREQIAAAIDLIVQQSRVADGSRLITSISEVVGMGDDGSVTLNEIFTRVAGADQGAPRLVSTGWAPFGQGGEASRP